MRYKYVSSMFRNKCVLGDAKNIEKINNLN